MFNMIKTSSSAAKKGLIVLGVLVAITFVVSMAVNLNNHSKVEANTDLTYYLTVSYDGVDKNGVESTGSTTSEVRSDIIHVEDKIPEGLTFQDFVTTADGTIGAVQRGTSIACAGRVVDDTNDPSPTSGTWINGNYTYHGLHYDSSTRTVTFDVKNLKAGCELVVGIITRTPATVDDPLTPAVETRRDFYNFGTAQEGPLTFNSNTVHVYMGDDNATSYRVTYQYTGTVPSNAPTVPSENTYSENNTVGVAPNPMLEGYTFSGWSTTDATISNGSFVMPAHDVLLTGSFTQMQKYNVTYSINGTAPPEYVVPSQKSYYPDSTVSIDSLQPGDVIGEYRFLGWEITSVTPEGYDIPVEDGLFTMPNFNVNIEGSFEENKYNVEYRFYDGVLPPNPESLLPATQQYKPGAIVSLATVNNPPGYEFLGWYKEDNFEMPEEDVIIYGEWKKVSGYFEPTITKTIVNPKAAYVPGETVTFNITVTNTASFPIKEVLVKEHRDDVTYIAGTGYTIVSDHFVNIATIPANGSVVVNAEYTIQETDKGVVVNTVEIKGALADNDYELKDETYIATADVPVDNRKNLTVNNTVKGTGADTTKDFTYTVYLEDEEDTEDRTTELDITLPGGVTTTIKGGETFTLKHGENAVIKVPKDYTITISERQESEYTTTVDKPSTDGRTVITTMTQDTAMTYVNTLDISPVTGVTNNTLPYLLLIAIVAIAGVVLVTLRDKIKVENKD